MVDSTDQCCPSVDFICSEFGAVSPELIPQDSFLEVVPYSSGSQREGQRPVTRWYWNRTKKDCLPFVFFGQGGNFNNFLTKEHCSNFCSVALCPLGSPLLQSSGSPALCTSSAECPYPYFCHSGRCCPSSESVCNQPMSEGVPCLAAPLPRFWFNASAGNCQRFIYNGCQGNSNSFQSLEACQKACEGVEAEPRCPHGSALRIKYGKLRRCGANSFETECPMNYECVHDGTASGCCPTAEYICSLPRNSGRSCKQTPTLRWYFDGIASSCRSFLFHGCDGNINNFPTKQICDEFCPRTALSCPYGGEYHRRGNGEAVECSSDKQCPFNYFCTTMSRRGTELRLCCPTRLSICSQGKDEGINCGQPATRYFFDKFTQQCRPMHFLGCGGNSNNFPSKEICYNFCLSSACGMFEVVLPSSSLGISFDCSKMPCPTGYSCVSDVFTPRRKVCCGTPNTDVCPNGLQPVNDPRTLLPISCRGGQFDVCPPNYHCLLHPTKKRHFCCGSTVRTETCPSGSRLIRLETGQPLGCNSQAVCPGGTTCQRPNPVGSGVCCKTLLHACPSGFVLDQTALEECSPLHRSHCSSTSSDSLCLFAETLQKFVCCKRENQLLPPLDCCPVTSTPKPRYFSNEQQCSVSKRCKGQTVCLDGKCVCRPGQVQLRMMCYWKCPANRKNVDGICV